MNDYKRPLAGAVGYALLGVSLMLGANEVAAGPAAQAVTVTNTPLPVQGTVSVGNPSTSPVNVRGVDEPARQPFFMSCGLSPELASGSATCYPHIAGLYQNQGGNVPAGKRFVVEIVSGTFNLSPGIKPAAILLETADFHAFFHANSDGPTCCYFGEGWSFIQPVRLYIDAGSNLPDVHVTLSATGSGGAFEVDLIGYLVSL